VNGAIRFAIAPYALADRFRIEHATIQIEREVCTDE